MQLEPSRPSAWLSFGLLVDFLTNSAFMNKRVIGSITIAVFLYIVLTICSAAERYVAVAVGSHYSQSFAAQIQQLDKLHAEQLRQNPDETAKAGQYILYARRATRAVIALLVSALMIWGARFKKDRELNTAYQPKAAAHSVLTGP